MPGFRTETPFSQLFVWAEAITEMVSKVMMEKTMVVVFLIGYDAGMISWHGSDMPG